MNLQTLEKANSLQIKIEECEKKLKKLNEPSNRISYAITSSSPGHVLDWLILNSDLNSQIEDIIIDFLTKEVAKLKAEFAKL